MADEMEAAVREAVTELVGNAGDGVTVRELVEFGWIELYDENPRLAVSALFHGLGRQATTSNALDVITALALSGDVGDPPALLHVTTTRARESTAPLTVGATTAVSGLISRGSNAGGELVVMTSRGISDVEVTRLKADEPLQVREVAGLDPDSGWRRVNGLTRVGEVVDAARATKALGAVRRALAYELLGVARGMLEIAVTHVSSRQQFGRPIGSNQAVRHRLADVHIANELAESALDFTWACPEEDFAYAAAIAKALASTAFETAMRHSMQVCGGMGFTVEFPLAPLVRRGLVLSPLFGDAVTLEAEIGELVVRTRKVPRLGGMEDR